MSAIKNPAIPLLDSGSLCYSLYSELYNQFFNAQDKKDEQHPFGVEEGDDTSIRLHNAAYGFAYAIAGAIDGGGTGSGGVLIDYLKRSGGDMAGPLRANYGFEAGVANTRVLEAYAHDQQGTAVYGVRIHGNLELAASGLYIGGEQLLSYEHSTQTTRLRGANIDLGGASVSCSGEWLLGTDKQTGVSVSGVGIRIAGREVYHAGNANLTTVDWSMHNAAAAGDLRVAGASSFSGSLTALAGVELGAAGRMMLCFAGEEALLNGFLSFGPGYGIRIDDKLVFARANLHDIQIGGLGGDLLLGNGQVNKIKLLSDVTDQDGTYTLVSRDGAACFPHSLTVRHNYGDEVLSSYRRDASDEGVVIHKRLRLGSSQGPHLASEGDMISFTSTAQDAQATTSIPYATRLGYRASSSFHRPEIRPSHCLSVDTQADIVRVNVPLEAKNHIGIDLSQTRLMDGVLFLSDERYLAASADGIRHFGNALFMASIGSERFSSGLAGSGWAIARNATTGNAAATFDELTVRKKMRIYELEVQKTSAANGGLWITDSCSGDSVEKIS